MAHSTYLRKQFEARLPAILARIRKCTLRGNTRDNALCWAWIVFADCVETTATLDRAAQRAAAIGLRRRFENFGLRRGDVRADALQHTECAPESALVESIDRPIHCDDDCPPAFKMRDIPVSLQPLAQCFAWGMRVPQAARELGYSVRTTERRKAELVEWVEARQFAGGAV